MSRISKRPGSRFYWYYWRDENGREQGKSLKTDIYEIAEVKKGEEDKKRHYGEAGLPFKAARWGTAREDFLKGYKDGKTKEGHVQSLDLFEECCSPLYPSKIDYKSAKGFRDWLQVKKSKLGRPYKPASVNIHLRNLHTFFSECKRMGYVTANPFDDVKQVPDTKRAPKYLRREQVQAVLAEARKSWPEDKVLMLLFFLYTGVRQGELINLKWSAIDLDKGLFYLRGSETWEPKDREEHAIGLHEELERGLRAHPKTSKYVFPGLRGGTKDPRSMRYLFNRLYKRAGITDRSGIHILRHTFLTHCNLPVKAKQLIAGHSDVRTTMKYDHVTPEDLAGVKRISYT